MWTLLQHECEEVFFLAGSDVAGPLAVGCWLLVVYLDVGLGSLERRQIHPSQCTLPRNVHARSSLLWQTVRPPTIKCKLLPPSNGGNERICSRLCMFGTEYRASCHCIRGLRRRALDVGAFLED